MNLSAEQFSQIVHALSQLPEPKIGVPQKRRAPRMEHRASIVISYLDQANAPALRLAPSAGGHGSGVTISRASQTVTVRNVSSRGIGILHPRPLATGEQFTIRLGRDRGGFIEILCTVAHCHRIEDTLFSVGAEFTCILPQTQPSPPANEESEAQRIANSILT